MKIQEGDYVDVSGMNEAERREVVQALLDCGVGEGFRYAHPNTDLDAIGVSDGRIFFFDIKEVERYFRVGRKLTLSDLRSPEWDGNCRPPNGTECEVTWGAKIEWCKCVVLDSKSFAYLSNIDERWCVSSARNAEFRTTKPEKEKAISEMLKDYPLADIATLEALHKAGYKKDTNL